MDRIPSSDFLRDADQVFDARGALKACLELVDEEKCAPKILNRVRLERSARVISAYELMVTPGPLQTEAYARALYTSRVPACTEEEVAARSAFVAGARTA
ncbi:Scr1 family TA system antitoxin-like transcriptional regulator [Streptomyces sp. NPDC005969]|uniref:Scr1 family TA system antitoxin-like transcriptional regulator n=1 Tax=Streptomyces sp. NPDC005969 TaxID=3156722 RepID=UPI0033F2DDFB